MRHFEVDNDKRGIKVFLDWEPSASARSAPELVPGYRIDVLELATPVRASIQVADMTAPRVLKGTLALTRSRTPGSESGLVQRRSDVVGVEPGSPFYLVALTPPKGVLPEAWLSLGTNADASSRADESPSEFSSDRSRATSRLARARSRTAFARVLARICRSHAAISALERPRNCARPW